MMESGAISQLKATGHLSGDRLRREQYSYSPPKALNLEPNRSNVLDRAIFEEIHCNTTDVNRATPNLVSTISNTAVPNEAVRGQTSDQNNAEIPRCNQTRWMHRQKICCIVENV